MCHRIYLLCYLRRVCTYCLGIKAIASMCYIGIFCARVFFLDFIIQSHLIVMSILY